MAQLDDLKNELFKSIYYNLGGDMVDVELDPNHYEYALKQAVEIFRQRSSNSVEESYLFLDLVADQQEYILPAEVQTVQQVFRRSIGSASTDNATQFEPFEAGFLNMYMLSSGRVGGLANYEFFAQYQEQSSKMFGGYVNYTFSSVSKKLTLVRRPRSDEEQVLLWVHKRADNPIYDKHGRKVINYNISITLLFILAFIALITVEGYGFLFFISPA